MYEAFLAAESKGRYFTQHIRNGFRCERICRADQAGSRPARDSRDLCTAEQLRNSILQAKARAIQFRSGTPLMPPVCSQAPAELTWLDRPPVGA